MKTTLRKILALLLCLSLCLGLVPAGFAEDDSWIEAGAGETEDAVADAYEETPFGETEDDVFVEYVDQTELMPEEPPYSESDSDALPAEEDGDPDSALAEADEAPDQPKHREYGSDVIVGFDAFDDIGTIETEYKPALVSLEKLFPEYLNAWLGGTVFYGSGADDSACVSGAEDYSVQSVNVSWRCMENYDDSLDEFHFTPVLEGYELADGLALPVLTVKVEREFEVPPLTYRPFEKGVDIPVNGPLSRDGYPIMRGDLPAYYNSYENGMLPAVRDQNPYGTCWAHAVIGAIEADLIHDGTASTSVDLSELHLAYFAYHNFYDEKGCNEGDSVSWPNGDDYLDNGGNEVLAYHTLANLVGCAREADIPYSWADSYAPSEDKGRAYESAQVTGVYWINSSDRDAIKTAILEHGGVAASMNWNYAGYSATHNSFYTDQSGTNHAIMLVGWDDSFRADHFGYMQPSAPGAWLVRNSWGYDDYGECGYFWMSYYDAGLLSDGVVAIDAQPQQYDHCYGYDATAFPNFRFDFDRSLSMSQQFTVDAGEQIKAVGFETDSSRLTVKLTLSDGTRRVSKTVTTGYPGFYLIQLDTPFAVKERGAVTLTLDYEGADGVYVSMQGEGSFNYFGPVFTAACGSGGAILNGYNYGYDAWLKLYTDEARGVAVNETNFPDEVFRTLVSERIDRDRDGYLSDSEIAAVTMIDCSVPTQSGAASEAWPVNYAAFLPGGAGDSMEIKGSGNAAAPISSLKGIEFFTALQILFCDGNRLTELDLSRNPALRIVACSDNLLSSLNVRQNSALELLLCGSNMLTGLDVRGCPALIALSCEKNELTELDLGGNPALQLLSCGYNHLSNLNLGKNAALDSVNCGDNPLGSLDVRSNTALTLLICGDASLTELILGQHPALTTLICNNNELTGLDLGGTPALQGLYCSSNRLSSLDVRGCQALQVLSCFDNRLTTLRLGKNTGLYNLQCSRNCLTALNIGGCSLLTELVNTCVPSKEDGIVTYSGIIDNLYCDLIYDENAVLDRLPMPTAEELADFGLDAAYLALKRGGPQVSLTVKGLSPEQMFRVGWTTEDADFRPDGSEAVIRLSADGRVTAAGAGTAYVCASIEDDSGQIHSARCRIDVVDGSVSDELAVNGVQLVEQKADVDLYRSDYAELNVLLVLDQNLSENSANAEGGALTDSGAAIESARFADPAAADAFTLHVKDDRTLQIVPSIDLTDAAAVKAMKTSFKSAVTVTVEGRAFTTPTAVTIAVKKAMPKISAKALKFNSLLPGDTQTPVFTGGTVTGLRLDESKPNADWLTLNADGSLTLKPGTQKAGGKLNLLADADGWAVSVPVVLSVSAAPTAPKLTIKPASLTLRPNSGDTARAVVSVSPAAFEEMPIEIARITEGSVNYDNGDVLFCFIEDGVLNVQTGYGFDAAKDRTFKVFLSVAGKESAVTVKTLAESKAATLSVKAAGTIDTGVANSFITLTATPKNFNSGSGECYIVNVTQLDAKTKAEEDVTALLFVETDGNVITLREKIQGSLASGYTYTACTRAILPDGTETPEVRTKLPVKFTAPGKALPSVTLKAGGGLDVIRPASAVTVTPTFKNYFGYVPAPTDLVFYSGTGKTAIEIADAPFNVEVDGSGFRLTLREGAELDAKTQKFSVGLRTADVSTQTPTAIPLKMGGAKLTQSTKTVTLLKKDRYSSAEVRVVPAEGGLSAIDAEKTLAHFASPADKGGNPCFALTYEGGAFVLRFAGNEVTTTKGAAVKIPVFLKGNAGAAPNATISVSVKIV